MAYKTEYGAFIKTAGSGSYRIVRPYIKYQVSNTATTTRIDWTVGVNVASNISSTGATINFKVTCTSRDYDYTAKTSSTKSGGSSYNTITNYFSWYKDTSSHSQTLTVKMWTSEESTSLSVTFTVPALAQYTLSYNANGGSGAPSSQKLFYGVAGKVNSNHPTRTGYAFQGWAESSSGSVKYAAGASITITANKTLYAVWKATYTVPTVKSITAFRVTDQNSVTLDNNGTWAYVKIVTTAGTNMSYKDNSYSVTITNPSGTSVSEKNISVSGNTYIIHFTINGGLSITQTYNFTATLSFKDNANTVTKSVSASSFISAEEYIIDIAPDGKRISFGQKASETGDRTKFKVEINNTELDDWIVESGTIISNSNPPWYWNYKKYADGTFEAWCHSNNTYTTPNQLAGAYDSSGKYIWYRSDARSLTINSGIGASQVLYANVNVADVSGIFTSITNYSGTQVTYYINCSQQITTARNCYITVYFFGTY